MHTTVLHSASGEHSRHSLLSSSDYVLAGESLFHDLSFVSTATEQNSLPLNLSCLHQVTTDPLSHTHNLIFNLLDEMAHEIALLKTHCALDRLIIVDPTNRLHHGSPEKLGELRELCQVDFMVGYCHPAHAGRSAQTTFLDNQVRLELSLGSAGLRPSFLGALMTRHSLDSLDEPTLQSYRNMTQQLNMPIFIDNSLCDSTQLDHFLNGLALPRASSVILLNPPITISTEVEQSPSKVSVCQSADPACLLKYLHQGMHLVLGVSQYPTELLAGVVVHLATQYPHFLGQLSLSAGLLFKTQLAKYGGQGYAIFFSFLATLSKDLPAETVRRLAHSNMVDRLDWCDKEVVKEEEKVEWECPQCHGLFPEPFEKITKLEKDYCSTKCMRQGLKK